MIRAVVGLLISCSPTLCQSKSDPRSIDFSGSKWIWSSPGAGVVQKSLPAGVNYLRATLTLPARAEVSSAEFIITADNLFALYLNGHSVGECAIGDSEWRRPHRYDIGSLLVPGRNVVAVEAVNTRPGSAGLLAKSVVRLKDATEIVFVSDQSWKCSAQDRLSWQQSDFDDSHWGPVRVVSEFGAAPWGKLAVRGSIQPKGIPVGKVHQRGKRVLQRATSDGWARTVAEVAASSDFAWPVAVVYVGDDCSLYRPPGPTGTAADSLTVTVFNPRKSRAYPEHDLPAPMKVGRKLYVIRPARPGVVPRVLLDAGTGALGSPSVSFDGESILVSLVKSGESFFHIYRVPADGGEPQRLTSGPFHDIDPAELPDGRVVFTSTRIGTFEEYHSPPSRSLFVMNADGSSVRPLTHTIIFDDEPEVLADGRIVFIRSDNFFDRGKVETRIHAIHPDGTSGQTEFGLHNAPEYGGRLRAFSCGSPAPLPDNRLAFVSDPGITVGRLGAPDGDLQHFRMAAGDVAALPDGRLLCTIGSQMSVEVAAKKGKKPRTIRETSYRKIGVLDPRSRPPVVTILHESTSGALHSAVYLGARQRPPVLPSTVDPKAVDDIGATGFLFCRDVRFTRNITAGWPHVRAIRVLAGQGLTTRSSHSYIVHAGNETTELGTVPLAPDGSFFIEVPANTPIALQAVDAEGRSELNEMSWIYVRPGERRGCIGCHQPRQTAPKRPAATPLAMGIPALKLLGQGQPHRFRGNNAAVTGLMELQFDRYREVAGINRHSRSVSELVETLRGEDADARIAAAQRLAVFRDAAAATALVENLGHKRREVRVAAAFALAVCGTRESVQPLLRALVDADALVAQAAAVALENLTGHAGAFNAFVEKSARALQAKNFAAWFSGTSWAQIESELLLRLQSPDRDVVRRAAVTLGHTGGELAREALRNYVGRESSTNPYPAWRSNRSHRGDGARFNALSAVNPRTLQAATRALGHLDDAAAVPLLAQTIRSNTDPATANLFLAEAAVEALGRIGNPAAEAALISAFAGLADYPKYTHWYGDHEALMACHASPVHYFIIEALDAMASVRAQSILPDLIRSLPIDPDRALLLQNDDYETLVGRVIRRNGAEAEVVETCLAILDDSNGKRSKAIAAAIASIDRCWAGPPDAENRAAQVLSLTCRDKKYEPRIRAALERYRRKPTTIPRVFDTGIPRVTGLPAKHWVCFFLARTLGNLADPQSARDLIAILRTTPAEASAGRPDPLGPGVLFLHDDLTPCWRAAVAWALGRIGDHRAAPVLLGIIADLENATDTRHAAARALGLVAEAADLEAMRELVADYPEISTRHALLDACENVSQR